MCVCVYNMYVYAYHRRKKFSTKLFFDFLISIRSVVLRKHAIKDIFRVTKDHKYKTRTTIYFIILLYIYVYINNFKTSLRDTRGKFLLKKIFKICKHCTKICIRTILSTTKNKFFLF